MQEIHNVIFAYGVFPVVSIKDAGTASPVAKALMAGSLPIMAVSFKENAAAGITNIVADHPEMLVGAADIASVDDAMQAIEAGAKFITTPRLDSGVVRWCLDRDVLVFPGCATPSDFTAARDFGLDVVRFCPVDQNTGLAELEEFTASFPSLRIILGGDNTLPAMAEALMRKETFACEWTPPCKTVQENNWEAITDAAREAQRTAQGYELDHIGVYTENDFQAVKAADDFANITALPIRPVRDVSLFVGAGIEIMKKPADCKAHIGYAVRNVERSARLLELKGYTFDMTTVRRNENGERVFGYLDGLFHGFLFHILPVRKE